MLLDRYGAQECGMMKISTDLGKLAENVVPAELKRRGEEVFFWQGSEEVDFV